MNTFFSLLPSGTSQISNDPVERELSPEEGSTTVEYAIGAVAAAAFAGLLLVIVQSDAVRAALQGIIERALAV